MTGHDYDVYRPGEEEYGFTACSVERAIEIIDEIEGDKDDWCFFNIAECSNYHGSYPDCCGNY